MGGAATAVVEQISAAMIRVYLELDLRQQLQQRGQANCRRFSWDRSAARVMLVLETCATPKASAV